MSGIVDNRICRIYTQVACGRIFDGVEVAVEAGEVAAADFETNLMSFQKYIAGGPQIDFVFQGLARLDGLWFAAC